MKLYEEKEDFSIIGTNYPKVDGEEKVTGKAKYAGDITMPGTLYCRFVRSPYPHARILSVDTSEAAKLPGVKAISTGEDYVNTLGCVEIDQATADKMPLCTDKVRYIGDEVVAVAAVSERVAQQACDLVKVEYEELPAYFTPQEAMAGTVAIHENVGEQFDADGSVREREINVNQYNVIEKGDVDKAFAEAAYTDKHVYQTQRITHGAIEPHACIATYENGEYTIFTSTQSVYIAQYWLARALGVPEGKVRVIKPRVGGGFGGKLDVYPHEACCCKLAEKTGHPVKMVLSREEVFEATRVRHPITIEIESAFSEDGTLLAKICRHYLNGGAYGGTGKPANALSILWENLPYRIPNLRMEAWRVYTNTTVGGAMRGYTSCQVHFASDCHMDEAAYDLGIDPVELRMKNVAYPGYRTRSGLKVTSCAMKETLEAASEIIRWDEKKNALDENEGIGFAASGFVSGTGYAVLTQPTNCSNFSMVRLNRNGYATVYSGANDIGQGLDTVLQVVVAEALGLEQDMVKVSSADTTIDPFDTGTLGSRGTFLGCNGAKRAAEDAARILRETAAERLGVSADDMIVKNHRIYVKDRPETGMDFNDVCWAYEEAHEGKGIVGMGSYAHVDLGDEYDGFTKGNYAPSYSFSTGAARVHVDKETGVVDINDFIFAHDCGRPLNPKSVEGQVEGSVQMGLGYALMEDEKEVNGRIINPGFRDYRFPTAMDMPEITTVFCGEPDKVGPYGAKECGEGSTAPVAPAIVNAVAQATGLRPHQIPVDPENLWRMLRESENRQ
ncbi:MAG: xanthine dehydrogenase family protein molybdopterin-binding subunit [Lentihominibacter sp.]